jgi:predicted regulator of Ras-like GTPase activity (Roadblock/LC7/MglB family)
MYAKILSHLNDLDNSSIDIESSALVSIDGLVMAATLPLDMDIDHMGAISAGTFLLGEHTSKRCASGVLEQVLIKCSKKPDCYDLGW